MVAHGFNILDFADQAPAHIEYPALQRVSDSPDKGGDDAEDCNCQGSHGALHWPGEVSVPASLAE